MNATTIRISKETHERLTNLARKNQSYDNLINEILDKNEELLDLNEIDEKYEEHLNNIIQKDNFMEYETTEDFIKDMRS
jgi:predicted CopG family antitoxin